MTLIQEDPLTSFENILFQTKSFQDNEIFFLKKNFQKKILCYYLYLIIIKMKKI